MEVCTIRCRALFFIPTANIQKFFLKTEKSHSSKPYSILQNTTTTMNKIFKKSKKSLPYTPQAHIPYKQTPVRQQNLHTGNPGDTFALQSRELEPWKCVNFKSVCFFWKVSCRDDTSPLFHKTTPRSKSHRPPHHSISPSTSAAEFTKGHRTICSNYFLNYKKLHVFL